MAEYGLFVSGTDTQGDYIVSNSSATFVPYVVANIGKGTSTPVPSNREDYLLYLNAKGLTNPNISDNGGIALVNVAVNTTTNVASFYSQSSNIIINQNKGTFAVDVTWETQSAYYIVLAKTAILDVPAANDYGVQIKDASGSEVFDSRKIYVNDTFRVLGEYTFDDPYDTLNVQQTQTVTTDENMFIEMNPFMEFSSTAGPPPEGQVGCCGPRFESTEILHELNTGSVALNAFFGSYTFGKLLYNNSTPASVLNALPAGFTVPY